jgi:lipopolysaccharide export system protein LptA
VNRKAILAFWMTLFLGTSLCAEQLKIISEFFEGDEKEGISVFSGNVKITKGKDELNATKVTVYTDKKRTPTKYVAQGNVSFFISAENNASYKGRAQKAVFLPQQQEYRFFKGVHLRQIDQRKQIDGDEVIVNIAEGRAVAKGAERKPVIMIFDIQEQNGTK